MGRELVTNTAPSFHRSPAKHDMFLANRLGTLPGIAMEQHRRSVEVGERVFTRTSRNQTTRGPRRSVIRTADLKPLAFKYPPDSADFQEDRTGAIAFSHGGFSVDMGHKFGQQGHAILLLGCCSHSQQGFCLNVVLPYLRMIENLGNRAIRGKLQYWSRA